MRHQKGQLFLGITKLSFFVAVFAAIILAVILLSKQMRAEADQQANATSLPKISISLNDVDLDTVKTGTKDKKYPGNEVILENGG